MERLEREPTPIELAEALGLAVEELASFRSQAQPRQLVSLDEMGEHEGEESLPLTERLADPHAIAPDDAALSAEDRQILLECLGALPKTQAMVIVLHYLQGVPLRDVAEKMRVTPSRVSQLHHQALDRLKQSFRRAQTMV